MRSKIHNLLGQENILIFTKPPTNLFLCRKCFDLTQIYSNVGLAIKRPKFGAWLGDPSPTASCLRDLCPLLYRPALPTQKRKLCTQISYHHYNHINTFFFVWVGNAKDTLANELARWVLLSISPTRLLRQAEHLQLEGGSLVSLGYSSYSWGESLSRAVVGFPSPFMPVVLFIAITQFNHLMVNCSNVTMKKYYFYKFK